MAKAISDEELQLRKRARRRLIGAIALVMLAVVLLPLLLDQEPRPVTQNISVQIPSPSSGAFVSKIVPVTPPEKTEARPKPVPPPPVVAPAPAPPAEVAAAPPPAPVAPAAKPKPKPEPVPPLVKAPPPPRSAPAATATDAGAEPKAAPKPKAEATADAKAGGFVVQVAALADAEKVKELQARISEAGLKTYTEPVATAKGTVTRVRAGPFATRPAAEEAREKLKAIGLAGTVIAR